MLNTLHEIEAVCRALEGKRLTQKALIKNNGLRSGKGCGMLAVGATTVGPTAIRQVVRRAPVCVMECPRSRGEVTTRIRSDAMRATRDTVQCA